jgi:2-iminobutanoate/2-iminopropanoate deaminase
MSGIRCWTFGPSEDIPDPVAPYSHAVAYGDLLHVTGQLPIDPDTGALVAGGIAEQTDAVMGHLDRVLRLCGSTLAAVISVRVYLTSFDEYAGFNRAYEQWFSAPLPARTCIGVTGLALGALVEVDLIAATDATQVRV